MTAVRLTELERRLEALETSVRALEHRIAELDALKKALGDLRFEVEDMQEA